MIAAAIVGASGYAGGELARLLARHPEAELVYVSTGTYAGQPLSKAFPGMSGTPAGKLICQPTNGVEAARSADVIFLAQESGAAMKSAGEILDLGKRVIDLSADFRLRNVETYEKWYKIEHQASMFLDDGTAVYGLPELNRTYIKNARLIANPGCYPTATILGLAPLLSKKLISSRGIVVDAKSGVSGAGRAKSDLMYRYAEANESVMAYNIGLHRHTPEIEQELSVHAAQDNVTVIFTPHLVPMTRGIHSTCYAHLIHKETTTEDVLNALAETYAHSHFVTIRDAGDYPSTKDVYGSNHCHIAAKVDPRTGMVVITSVIDNLVKGAAGQAIQNMNLMFGFAENAGLEAGGIWP